MGTPVATYDCARYNEEILKNESIIVYNPNNRCHPQAIEKFGRRFKLRSYEGVGEMDEILREEKADLFSIYQVKNLRL